MELHKIPKEEILGFDIPRRREVETQIRRELLQVRMDIFSSKAQHSARIRGLKKTLARILTVDSTAGKVTSKLVKPAAVVKKPVATAKKAPAKADAKAKKTEAKK